MNKIISIKERLPETTLPDGNYFGVHSGYPIVVKYKDKIYDLQTASGVCGNNSRVIVTVKDGAATFIFLDN